MSTYSYIPLSDNVEHFRLLTVDSISSYGGTWTRLNCELDWWSIDVAPSYTALSYRWGDDVSAAVYINGRSLAIPRSLHSFLGCLAERPEHSSTIRFYADAICINQSNGDEQSSQIPAMGSIYGNAEHVRCWLDDATDGDRSILKILANPGVELDKVSRYEARSVLAGAFRAVKDSQKRSQPDSHEWTVRLWAIRSLAEIMRKPYWTRLWIIQEVILARKLTLHCGQFTFGWSQVDQWLPSQHNGAKNCILDCFGAYVDTYTTSYTASGIPQVTSNVLNPPWKTEWRELQYGRVGVLNQWRKQHFRPTLMHAINEFGYSECKWPRDHVYGLLGLVNDPLLASLVNIKKHSLSIFFDVMLHCRRHLTSDSLFKFATKLCAILKVDPAIILSGPSQGTLDSYYAAMVPSSDSTSRFPARLDLESLVSILPVSQGQQSFTVRLPSDLSSFSTLSLFQTTIANITCFTSSQAELRRDDLFYRIRGTRCGLIFTNPRIKGRPFLKGRYVAALSSSNTASARGLARRRFSYYSDAPSNPPGPGVPDSEEIQITDLTELLVLATNLDPETHNAGSELPIGFGF